MSPYRAEPVFGRLHDQLREELDSVVAEPMPQDWSEILLQIDDQEFPDGSGSAGR
jgi:hypothetical protein